MSQPIARPTPVTAFRHSHWLFTSQLIARGCSHRSPFKPGLEVFSGPDHNQLTHAHAHAHAHALLRSFYSSNPFSLFFARMASPTLLIVPLSLSYSDPSSSTLGTVHTHRTSSEATAETFFSLYGDGAIADTQQTLRVSLLCESANPCQLQTKIHPCPS